LISEMTAPAIHAHGNIYVPNQRPYAIIIGVDELRATDRCKLPRLSPADLAGEAARSAIADAGATGPLAVSIDTVAAIRQFEI